MVMEADELVRRDRVWWFEQRPLTPATTENLPEFCWAVTLVDDANQRVSMRVIEYTKERAAIRAVGLCKEFNVGLMYPVRIEPEQVSKYSGWRNHHTLAEGRL